MTIATAVTLFDRILQRIAELEYKCLIWNLKTITFYNTTSNHAAQYFMI